MRLYGLSLLVTFSPAVRSALVANQTDSYLLLANDRLTAAVNKSTGAVYYLSLDGQNLLGTEATTPVTPGGATGNGNSGIGPYLDCYCTPEGSYTPGSHNATYDLYQAVDSSNVSYGGISMSQTYTPTGQVLQQYWFLRDGETGLHLFSRLYYYNDTTENSGVLQELRTLFRPNLDTSIWTHLITNDEIYAPLPRPDPAVGNTANATTVQDATWYIGDRTDDPYVEAFADYFTKYSFSADYGDQLAHGMYGNGSLSSDGTTYGSWLVMNTKDTYFGGPTWSDLAVDGIVYNYITSNHHGDQAPNITNGFDRTFGPSYYHFNHADNGTTWQELRGEALALATPQWNAQFYDDIAYLVPNYVPTSRRGSWKATVSLPEGAASRATAVLSASGYDFQDNAQDTTAYQYWADIDSETGAVEIERVKEGTYRLTVFAEGIFGDYSQDGVVVSAGEATVSNVSWVAESAGKELWRIGTP